MTRREIIQVLRSARRIGAEYDKPEGTRYIQISDTLTKRMVGSTETMIQTGQKIMEQSVIGKRIVAVSWLPMPGFDALFNLKSITLEGGIKLEVWASDSRESVCAQVRDFEE